MASYYNDRELRLSIDKSYYDAVGIDINMDKVSC
jgi:hypothetical protein